MRSVAKLRVARPTDNIDVLIPFYRDGLGLDLLFRFENHDGFDGIMFGREGAPYHFEFTRAHGHASGRAPTQDNLLIFYLPDPGELGGGDSPHGVGGVHAGTGVQPVLGSVWAHV